MKGAANTRQHLTAHPIRSPSLLLPALTLSLPLCCLRCQPPASCLPRASTCSSATCPHWAATIAFPFASPATTRTSCTTLLSIMRTLTAIQLQHPHKATQQAAHTAAGCCCAAPPLTVLCTCCAAVSWLMRLVRCGSTPGSVTRTYCSSLVRAELSSLLAGSTQCSWPPDCDVLRVSRAGCCSADEGAAGSRANRIGDHEAVGDGRLPRREAGSQAQHRRGQTQPQHKAPLTPSQLHLSLTQSAAASG